MSARKTQNSILPLLYTFLVVCFPFLGCSSEQTLTSDQRQVLQSRFFTGITYPELMQVIVEMLKDSGFQTTTFDPEQGVIVGTLRSTNPLHNATRFGRDSFSSLRQGERMEALFNVRNVDAENVGVRLSLQLLPEYSLGVIRGEEIQETQAYQRFFTNLQALVKKRIARGGVSPR